MWRILAIVFFGLIVVQNYNLYIPFIDFQGEKTTGSFRGIKIGESKGSVFVVNRYSRLKLIAYSKDDITCNLPLPCPIEIMDASVWEMNYATFLNERIYVYFENDKVIKIEYIRNRATLP